MTGVERAYVEFSEGLIAQLHMRKISSNRHELHINVGISFPFNGETFSSVYSSLPIVIQRFNDAYQLYRDHNPPSTSMVIYDQNATSIDLKQHPPIVNSYTSEQAALRFSTYLYQDEQAVRSYSKYLKTKPELKYFPIIDVLLGIGLIIRGSFMLHSTTL
jgi:hypothetical protein